MYDKHFREFKEKLIQEYSQMNIAYIEEFEENYQANLQEKNTHI